MAGRRLARFQHGGPTASGGHFGLREAEPVPDPKMAGEASVPHGGGAGPAGHRPRRCHGNGWGAGAGWNRRGWSRPGWGQGQRG